jgi:cytochrome c-type biogenesis protein
MTGLLKIKLLYMEKRLLSFKIGKGAFSSVLIGMAFATGWTPCAGPILASILIYAGSMDTLTTGTLLLTAYSLGLAVPFILTALAIESFSNRLRSITKHMRGVSFVSGILMIIMGIMIVTNSIGILSRYMNFFNI